MPAMTLERMLKERDFGLSEMTDAINLVPNRYGLLEQIGLFQIASTRTLIVKVEFRNGVLNVIPSAKRGAPATQNRAGDRKVRYFEPIHVPLDDRVTADDLQGVRRFGEEYMLEDVIEVVGDRLEDMASKHYQTQEFYRWGALRGSVIDADGSELYNVYNELEEIQVSFDFKLGTVGNDVADNSGQIRRHLQRNAKGELISGVVAFCSEEFFFKLTTKAEIKEAYDKYLDMSGQEPLKNDLHAGFRHKGITYVEHIGEATHFAQDGTTTTHRFIAQGEAIAVPLGTTQTFREYYAPADYLEAVNMPGQQLYAKTLPDRSNKGIDIETQSNPLMIVTQPRLVMRLHSTT